MSSERVRIGIIGGGLMGRELASAIGRWFVLQDHNIRPELVAICDLDPAALDWFRRIQGVRLFTSDYQELIQSDDVDVVYAAVPHHLHEKIYCDVLDAGKDLLAEKPFGIDLGAAQRICRKISDSGRFARCSSEFPFFPGAQRAFEYASQGGLGRLLEVRSGFWHSSDLDPTKPANWKRMESSCGKIGVMGDLGMHTVHMPFRLGWIPQDVFAQLQKGYARRPDGRGGMADCDTWDNAVLHTSFLHELEPVIMRFEMKRLAPAATNTWFFEVLGTDGGVRFSTSTPKSVFFFERGRDQSWKRVDLGFASVFPTITGGIFEPGFPDCFLQMWASFLAERAGSLSGRFGCATPEEALAAHQLFDAAMHSHQSRCAVPLTLNASTT
jgi:predicted dehydrogenase